jgi:hypothetical protein
MPVYESLPLPVTIRVIDADEAVLMEQQQVIELLLKRKRLLREIEAIDRVLELKQEQLEIRKRVRIAQPESE